MILKTEEMLEAARVELLPDALVTISIEGLALSCINARGECEVGMMNRDDHTMIMEVLQVKPDVIEFQHSLRLDLDILIDVTHSPHERAEPHIVGASDGAEYDEAFDRISERGHPGDFRWIIDLEGQDTFHQRQLRFKTRLENGRAGGLNPIFIIPRGKLYTRQRVKKSLVSVRWDDLRPRNEDPHFLGKIGHVFGIDISSYDSPYSKVVLTNVDRQGRPVAGIPPLELKYRPGTKYEIKISNLCTVSGDFNSNLPDQGTDFRFYYDILEDPDPERKKFDLKNTIEIGTPGHNGHPIVDKPDLGVNRTPQACEVAFLGQTNSLTGR